jgi:hypothetical protein
VRLLQMIDAESVGLLPIGILFFRAIVTKLAKL